MPDREFWRFINTFAPWGSALASTAAVVTALYLARRGDRIRLKVAAGVRIIFMMGPGGPPPEHYATIEVTNVGRRTVTITGLYFRDPSPFTRREFTWIPAPNPLSTGALPQTLADGESRRWVTPIATFTHGFDDHFRGVRGWLRASRFRGGVATTAGGRFESEIDRTLRQALRRSARGLT